MPTSSPPRRQPPWPNETDAVPLPDGHPWTPQEHWAWARILRGYVAEMSRFAGPREKFATFADWLNGADDGAGADAGDRDIEDNLTPWPEHRILSGAFLRTVLFHEPWASAPVQPWLRVACAQFDERLGWAAETYAGELWFDRCRFLAGAAWTGLKVAGTLSLEGSHMAKDLNADRLETEGTLYCDKLTARGDVRFLGAKIGGVATFAGARLDAGLLADGLETRGDIFCRREFVCKGPTRLLGAKIGGDIGFTGATFQELNADRIETAGSLFCNDGFVAHREVRMLGAKIKGTASFVGATLHEGLRADRIEIVGGLFCREGFQSTGPVRVPGAIVGGDIDFIDATLLDRLHAPGIEARGYVLLREVKKFAGADFIGARIGRDVQISDSAILGVLDFTNARIDGELQTAQRENSSPDWGPKARLILRNAHVGALAGGAGSFPKSARNAEVPAMDLTGFTYDRLGGLGAERAGSLAKASVKELKAWLEAGHMRRGEFTPGPYRVLAAALVEAGQSREANHILYAMRALDARCEKSWFRKVRLFFSDLFIGYGHKSWRAFAWFLALVIGYAGYGLFLERQTAFVPTPAGLDTLLQWLGFSLGNAVPVVSLDKAHELFLAHAFAKGEPLDMPARIAWAFYWQKILGFIVLSYLAAGVSGLAARQRE